MYIEERSKEEGRKGRREFLDKIDGQRETEKKITL